MGASSYSTENIPAWWTSQERASEGAGPYPRLRPSRPAPFSIIQYYSGEDSELHSLSVTPNRPQNNTLNTQSRAQQTHIRSRSLRAHPRRVDPP
eukprot:scaffold14242_cov55-Phaeocystis_antarctica.AAC.3